MSCNSLCLVVPLVQKVPLSLIIRWLLLFTRNILESQHPCILSFVCLRLLFLPSIHLSHIIMSEHEMNGEDNIELTEEEKADMEAEIEEGYAEIEEQSVWSGISWSRVCRKGHY